MTWLSSVGGITVERITDVKRSGVKADSNPPKGVLHTTEGSWGSSLNVFRYNTGTPTFMVGRDGTTRQGVGYNGRLRIAQFMPIGEMCLTLENDSGGVETNRDALVQIEIVAFSQREPWLPDTETAALLRALISDIKEVAGVPLKRGGNGTRSISNWNNNSGWFAHSEVPENDHWDVGEIRWNVLLSGDEQEEVEMIPAWFSQWKRWFIVGRPKGVPQPAIAGLPSPIPQWAWEDVALTAEIHRALGPPLIYQQWRNGRLIGSPMPENANPNEWWWEGAQADHYFANQYAEKADDPLELEIQQKLQQIVQLQNQVASLQFELEEALANDSAEVEALRAKIANLKGELEALIADLNTV